MSKVSTDVQVLLEEAEQSAQRIAQLHQRLMAGDNTQNQLAVEVKHFVGDLDSALDYLAQEIFRKSCSRPGKRKPDFPLFRKRSEFAGQVESSFPGLKQSNRQLWNYLESIQPYPQRGKRLRSLRALQGLVNTKKHRRLIRQRRKAVPVGDPRARQLGPVVYRQTSTGSDLWIDFVFEGTKISAIALATFAVGEVREISDEVAQYL